MGVLVGYQGVRLTRKRDRFLSTENSMIPIFNRYINMAVARKGLTEKQAYARACGSLAHTLLSFQGNPPPPLTQDHFDLLMDLLAHTDLMDRPTEFGLFIESLGHLSPTTLEEATREAKGSSSQRTTLNKQVRTMANRAGGYNRVDD